ncbi:MAG: glycosyltransferase family 39 protein [Gemmatimonadota bacterium]
MNPPQAAEYGGSTPQAAEYWSRALLVVGAAGLIRLVIASQAPLFPDETYYWEWSRRLAAGYFDHPPLVAWLIRLGTLIFGDSPLGVRFGPVLAGIVGSLLLILAARRLGGDRAAFMAAVVFVVMPLSAAGLILATPDAGLLTAATGVIYAAVRALEHPAKSRQSLQWWCVAGAVQGIAFWAKYTAILVPAGLAIALVLHAGHRARLREPGPYVATLIASLIFSPVLLWNANHDWVSFTYQLQHGLVGSGGSMLRRESELLGGQLGVVSPILFVLMLNAVIRGARGPAATSISRVLSVATLFVLAFFAYSATQRRVEANWPALAYLPATLLLAAHPRSARWDRWLNAGVAVAVVITLVTYLNTFVPVLPVPVARDPAARASGWGDLARVVAQVRDSQVGSRVTSPKSRMFIAGNRYQEASELAFHLPGHPRTLSLNYHGRPNQYDLWPRFTERAKRGDKLILIVDDLGAGADALITALTPHFDDVNTGLPVTLVRGGDVVKYLRMWELAGWRGTWPQSPLRSRP